MACFMPYEPMAVKKVLRGSSGIAEDRLESVTANGLSSDSFSAGMG